MRGFSRCVMRLMAPPLPAEVAALEDHQHLELLMLHPVLQPHQFVLQPEQFAKIDLAVERLLGRPGHALGDQLVEPVLLHLHLQFLVETVGDFLLDAAEFVSLAVVHGAGPRCRPTSHRLLQQ